MSNTTKFCPFCGELIADNIVICPHCGEAVIYSPKDDRQIFRTAKRLLSDSYELLETIEQDGKYIRYKAVRRKDYTPVTISILNTDQVNSYSEIEFFLLQNKITARLKHKHILPVYDYGVIKGLPYAVTPYLQEKSLKEILKRSRSLPESECVEIIKEVATALDYAHKQGIIHGHLTPEQIFYSNDKQVYVSGFAYEGQNVSMGFPEINPYMSPEQIKGDAFDIKADMYGLAVIFYTCLNGHLPDSLRSAKKRLSFYYKQDLFSFIKNDPSIKSFKTFFQKALARDRAKRYKSLGNFTRALTLRRAVCPICGTTKPVERFTCPECGRENICISHITKNGICSDCIEQKKAKAQYSKDRTEKEKPNEKHLSSYSKKIKFEKKNNFYEFIQEYSILLLKRFIALLIDILFIFLIAYLFEILFYKKKLNPLEFYYHLNIHSGFYYVFIAYLYFVISEISPINASLGKYFLGLYVDYSEGRDSPFLQSSIRFLFKIYSFTIIFVLIFRVPPLGVYIAYFLYRLSMFWLMYKMEETGAIGTHDMISGTLIKRKE